MRLFIAAELPDEMLEALAETSAVLRANVRGRFVSPNSFHVTLAFLGDVKSHRIDDIVSALEGAYRELAAANGSLGDLGSFGKRSSATLWQGFSNPGVLAGAAEHVRYELTLRDFSFDSKKFIPHVTLMRAANLNAGSLPAPCRASGAIDTITLFHSDLSGPRPVYERLHVVELPHHSELSS